MTFESNTKLYKYLDTYKLKRKIIVDKTKKSPTLKKKGEYNAQSKSGLTPDIKSLIKLI